MATGGKGGGGFTHWGTGREKAAPPKPLWCGPPRSGRCKRRRPGLPTARTQRPLPPLPLRRRALSAPHPQTAGTQRARSVPSPTPYPHPSLPGVAAFGHAGRRAPPYYARLASAPRLERLLRPFPPRALLTELFPPASPPSFVPAAQRRTARHTPPPPPATLRPRLARWARDWARGEDRACAGASRAGRSEEVQNTPPTSR